MIHYKKDNHQIVHLSLDMSNRRVNIINHEVAQALVPVLEQLEAERDKGALRGVILRSLKTSFLAGGDLDYLYHTQSAAAAFAYTKSVQAIFRRLERLQVPVVAAINGAALGTGYEFALACHYRIALDRPSTVVGLPEVTLGMMPASGGLSRLTWMLGIEKAYPILSQGKRYHVKEAKQLGLIDAVASSPKDLLEQAEAWILSNPKLERPWDNKGVPAHNNPKRAQTAQLIAALNAQLRQRSYGNYPAQQAILNAMVEGGYVDFDTACRIESRYFAQLICSPTCKNMTKAFWYDFKKNRNGNSRPKGYGRFRARRIGIIGAGKMGAGIAYIAAMAEIEVVLKDVTLPIAEQGLERIQQKLEKLIENGKMTQPQMQEILARIQVTDKANVFEECDLVVEAVFENKDLKMRLTRETQNALHREAFMTSNTSTIPISELARASQQPGKFIGLHFFSPVEQVPAVEIIRGAATDDETVARAFDFTQQIGRIPIVVKDSRGFFTSRIFKAYVLEAMTLLQEGQAPATIEHAALKAGMRLAPLAIADRIGLPFILKIEQLMQTDEDYEPHPAIAILERMVEEFARKGQINQAGFYEYQKGQRHRLWPELNEHFPLSVPQLSHEEMSDRLLFVQCIETVECMEKGIIKKAANANLASIHAWGFVPFKGGVLQFINDYGLPAFVERCDALAAQYGSRFAPPQLLRTMAAAGEAFE